MSFQILSLIIFTPFVGAILVLLIPSQKSKLIKAFSALVSFITLVASLLMFLKYDRLQGGMQFTENHVWVQKFGINFDLGVDGLSLPLILLTSIIFFCAVLVSWNIDKRPKEFFFYTMLVIGGVFGVFASRDLFCLFFFIEVAVVPKFILINLWGSKMKEYAAIKYTFYLLAGSAVALIGIIAIYIYAGDSVKGLGFATFDIHKLSTVKFDENFQKFAFLLIMIGFGVLVPIWPLHRWTPDGHSAAPTAISMILAGVIMKLGGYSLIRVGINLFPLGAEFWSPVIAVLATVNAVYIAFVALVQKDIKYVVANSSVSHMGYVLIGIASLNAASIDGAAAQMFAHGIMAALFFALVGNIYDKTHTRQISDFGGLARQMPKTAVFFVIAGLASLGLPGTVNFISEFAIFIGSIKVFPALAVISIFAVVVTAIYVLNVIHKMFFGPSNPKWDHIKDVKGIEMVPMIILSSVIILFGIVPDKLMGIIDGGIIPFVQKLVSLKAGGSF